jgi:hypothetical protein
MNNKQETGIPPQVMGFAAFMLAEFLIFLGLFLIVLGIARVIGKFIGIDGSGEIVIGIALLVFGYLTVLRTKPKKVIITQRVSPPLGEEGMEGPQMEMPSEPPPSGTYR